MEVEIDFKEKSSKELEELAEHYFSQHKAMMEGPKTDRERHDDMAKDYMAKIREIDKILMERNEH